MQSQISNGIKKTSALSDRFPIAVSRRLKITFGTKCFIKIHFECSLFVIKNGTGS